MVDTNIIADAMVKSENMSFLRSFLSTNPSVCVCTVQATIFLGLYSSDDNFIQSEYFASASIACRVEKLVARMFLDFLYLYSE